jgi:large subunit ribosomal protein L22
MEKQFKATQKFLLMSPRKIRLLVGMIKKMKPSEAVEKLPFVQRRASAELAKVIKSAIASAKNQGVSETDLVFKEIQIGEGPRLKRGRPVSRGMWHPFKRRMSHIRVVLTTLNKQMPNVKLQINTNEKKTETKTKAENSKLSTDKKGGKK